MTANLQMRAGESFRLDTAVTDEYGVPRNLTGATGTFLVYSSPTARTPVALTGSVSVIDAAGGVVASVLADTVTDSIVGTYPRVFYFEVKITESNATETVVENGRLLCLP